MGKIVRLTESELIRLVRKTIQESQANQQIAGSAAVGLAVGGIPGAIVGGLIGYANAGGSVDNVLQTLKYCRSKGMGKPSISVQQASGIADKINGWGNYGGTGIYVRDKNLYASSDQGIFLYQLNDQDEVVNPTTPKVIVKDLIDRRQHSSKSITSE